MKQASFYNIFGIEIIIYFYDDLQKFTLAILLPYWIVTHVRNVGELI